MGRVLRTAMRRTILAYDADCGPCARFKQAVDFLDTRRRLEFMGLAEADSARVLDGVPPSRRHRSFHLVVPDGEVLSGAEAIPALVSLMPGGRLFSRLLVSVPKGPRAVGFVYGVFSRLHDDGSCHYRPGSGSPSSRMVGKTSTLPPSLDGV